MECKFVKHGLSISYDKILKPCCVWESDSEWQQHNHINQTQLISWQNNLRHTSELLDNGVWPKSCRNCKNSESVRKENSVRFSGNQAYHQYSNNDMVLEIRPGNVCNFACQTCWPEASSRVAQYHHKAGLIDIKNLNSNAIDNFDFLLPVADRIKDVVLLGGEPFYDKNCKKFIDWASKNLNANITMFTNGSCVDIDVLNSYPKKVTLVFSIDAVGKSAEYIRYGTVWQDVVDNYIRASSLGNVEIRVNITCSIYNYQHLKEIFEFLSTSWPAVVTFGFPKNTMLTELAIPIALRKDIVKSISDAVSLVQSLSIQSDQSSHIVGVLDSIIARLHNSEFEPQLLDQLCNFINSMDRVKNISHVDHSDFLKKLVRYQQSGEI